jgi:hypothetical protein
VEITDEAAEMHSKERDRLLAILENTLGMDTAARGRVIHVSTLGVVDSRNHPRV